MEHLSLGRTAPESGNHKKSAVETKCGKTFAGVRELTQNFEPLYYLPGENRSENTTEENTTEIPQEHQVEGFPP